MQNFQSKTLNRTFESILFAGAIIVEDSAAAPSAVQGQGGMSAAQPQDMEAPKKGDIAKAGYTVEEIFAKKGSLGSKTVDIRGKVVKANQNILGTNWYHIQDGTGAEGTNDLLVTSSDNAEVGNTVVAKGTLSLDKDFGSGYKFAVIVEEAKLAVE